GFSADTMATVTVSVPTSDSAPSGTDGDARWHAALVEGTNTDVLVGDRAPDVNRAGGRIEMTLSARAFAAGSTRTVALATDSTQEVPVLISDGFAQSLGVSVGDVLDLRMGTASIPAAIVGTLAYVPSQPGADALLTDHITLTQALATYGEFIPTVDVWWASVP